MRQRHVFPTDEIAHLWAHKTQDKARNPQGNFYFEGDTIYSYGSHFPIASHVTHKGRRGVNITTRSYGPTTGKHINLVRQAIPLSLVRLALHDPRITRLQGRNEHISNVQQRAQDLANARKGASQVKRYRLYFAACETANIYFEFFGYTRRYKPDVDMAVVAAEARAYIETQEARQATCERNAAAKFAKRLPVIQAEWRAGGHIDWFSIGRGVAARVPVMLRVNGDDVETSLGARFPLVHALNALPLVLRLIRHHKVYQRDKYTIRLGHYVIERIEEDGTVVVGCHRVGKDEIELLATRLDSYA